MNNIVSIIIPVYNVEKHIKRCLDSVLSQTYNELEIIIIDDGSTDDSYKICEQYSKIDNRIKLIQQSNSGQSSARNRGLSVSSGRYISFIDSDDWISDNYIEHLVECMTKENADISIVDMIVTDNHSFTSINNTNNSYKVFNSKEAIEAILLQNEFDTGPHCKLYKKELFDNLNFKSGIIYEDLDLIYRIINISSKVVFSNKAKYYYYENPNGTMKETMSQRHLVILDISREMTNNISRWYPELTLQCYKRYVLSMFIILEKIYYSKTQNEYFDTIIKIKEIIKSNKDFIFNNPYIKFFSKLKLRALLCSFNLYKIIVKFKDIVVGVKR